MLIQGMKIALPVLDAKPGWPSQFLCRTSEKTNPAVVEKHQE